MTKAKHVLLGTTALLASTFSLMACSSNSPYTGAPNTDDSNMNSVNQNTVTPNQNGNNKEILSSAFANEGIRMKAVGNKILLIPSHAILFANNSANLTQQDKDSLDSVIRVLKSSTVSAYVGRSLYTDSNGSQEFKPRANYEVRLVGHASSKGDSDYNQQLSEKRADAVSAYLSDQGIDSSRVTTVGKGESMPVANNITKAGQAANRRVDILLVPVAQ